MTNGTRDDDSGRGSDGKSPPDEAALSARLGSLNQRLSKLQDDRKFQTDQSETGSGNAQARASELVAGVVVGTVLGWGFDRLLSTSPWGLIVFMLLGFVAGVINVMRSAGVGKTQ
jgi:ATP synthase protein I